MTINAGAMSTHAAASTATSTADALGLKVPAGLVTELAAADELTPAGVGIRYDADALGAAVVAAVEADRDPLDDPAVVRQAVAKLLGTVGVGEILTRQAEARRAAALVKHLPALVASWSSVVDDAARHVDELQKVAPRVSLTDPNAVNAVPAQHLTAWGMARDALARVDKVAQTWRAVVPATGVAARIQHAPLVLADLTADQLHRVGARATAAQVVEAGHRLALADVDIYRARVRAVTEQDAHAQAQREADRDKRHAGVVIAQRVR